MKGIWGISVIAAVLILGSLGFSQQVFALTIEWADSARDPQVVGSPDGVTVGGTPDIAGFGLGDSDAFDLPSLASTLGVSEEVLADAEFIVFEINGSPIDFESADIQFDDGVNHSTTLYTFGQPLPPEIIGKGILSSSDYSDLFGAAISPDRVAPFLLLDLDDLGVDAFSSDITARLARNPVGPAGLDTPDFDAIGRINTLISEGTIVWINPAEKLGKIAEDGCEDESCWHPFQIPKDLADSDYSPQVGDRVSFDLGPGNTASNVVQIGKFVELTVTDLGGNKLVNHQCGVIPNSPDPPITGFSDVNGIIILEIPSEVSSIQEIFCPITPEYCPFFQTLNPPFVLNEGTTSFDISRTPLGSPGSCPF